MILRLALNLKFLTEALDWDSEIWAGDHLMISVIRALAVGAIGGVLAFVIGVPAPWLAGSLVATIIAVYSNQKSGTSGLVADPCLHPAGHPDRNGGQCRYAVPGGAMAVEHFMHEHHRGDHRLGLHAVL